MHSLSDYSYKKTDQHRLWQAWINTSIESPILELEVKYPAGVLQLENGSNYMFRMALEWATSEADRANNAFNGELSDDIVLSKKNTKPLKISVPL